MENTTIRISENNTVFAAEFGEQLTTRREAELSAALMRLLFDLGWRFKQLVIEDEQILDDGTIFIQRTPIVAHIRNNVIHEESPRTCKLSHV